MLNLLIRSAEWPAPLASVASGRVIELRSRLMIRSNTLLD